MFRAAIFDMDGTLIDSEAYWRNAEREVFGTVGVDITDEMALATAPMTPRQVCEHWYRLRPWPEPEFERLEAAVVERVAEQIRSRCEELPGVRQALALCESLQWRLALASNSPSSLCHLVLRELDLSARFDAVVTADDVENGKPDPAIYLLAARRLGADPRECLAFEDTLTGVRAARAAGMRVVAIPSCGQDIAEGEPDLVLTCMDQFAGHHVEKLWRST
jgi:HAD superfamily hydrolase (TIGR01509 family)